MCISRHYRVKMNVSVKYGCLHLLSGTYHHFPALPLFLNDQQPKRAEKQMRAKHSKLDVGKWVCCSSAPSISDASGQYLTLLVIQLSSNIDASSTLFKCQKLTEALEQTQIVADERTPKSMSTSVFSRRKTERFHAHTNIGRKARSLDQLLRLEVLPQVEHLPSGQA